MFHSLFILTLVNTAFFSILLDTPHIFIFLFSDDGGRYTYSKQPEICKWNCQKLAEDIQDALPLEKSLPELEAIFDKTYEDEFFRKMKKKVNLKLYFVPFFII